MTSRLVALIGGLALGGLAIAQAHGGLIEVESEIEAGSIFTLVVPTGGPDEEP